MRKIEKWLGHEFESSCYTTDEFLEFSKDFMKFLRRETKKSDLEISDFSLGHFEVSGFLKNNKTDKMAYFSVSDVRFFKDEWFNNVLVRTAKNNKDFTGGFNNYINLFGLVDKAKLLTS